MMFKTKNYKTAFLEICLVLLVVNCASILGCRGGNESWSSSQREASRREWERETEKTYRRFILGMHASQQVPSMEEIALMEIAQEGVSRKRILGVATHKLYIKNLAVIVRTAPRISSSLMTCLLRHLCLNKDNFLAFKKNKDDRVGLLAKDEIEIALARLTGHLRGGEYDLRDFLEKQNRLYDLIPPPDYSGATRSILNS